MASFEDRLWAHLVEEHGALLAEPAGRAPIVQPARRPAPRLLRRGVLAGAAAALAGALAAILIGLGSGGSPAAYAVTQNADGTVTVTIRQLVGVTGADAKLRSLGLPVRAAPLRPSCPPSARSYRLVQLPSAEMHALVLPAGPPGNASRRIDPAAIPRGDTLLLAARERQPGVVSLQVDLYSGAAPRCVAEG